MVTTLPKPVTAAAREAIRQRAIAAGKKPTTASINATFAKNKATKAAAAKVIAPQPVPTGTMNATAAAGKAIDDSVTSSGNAMWNGMAGAIKGGATPAAAYKAATGMEPSATELKMPGDKYLAQNLMQFEGSPQLGAIDVSKGYAGDQAKAYLAYLKKIGPAGYVGVNSGLRDDREYASVLAAAEQYAALPTGVRTYNPNITSTPQSATASPATSRATKPTAPLPPAVGSVGEADLASGWSDSRLSPFRRGTRRASGRNRTPPRPPKI
jgi:hypothetical protein